VLKVVKKKSFGFSNKFSYEFGKPINDEWINKWSILNCVFEDVVSLYTCNLGQDYNCVNWWSNIGVHLTFENVSKVVKKAFVSQINIILI